MKKTKIVCTMGPNTNDREMMRKLIQNGMNVARFNFSHGDHEEQKFRMDMLKELREEEHTNTAILLDTKGPEIRTGILKDGKKITLKEGETFTLTTEDIVGDNKRVSITYKGLVQDIYKGCTILIDDGLIGLRVESKTETEIVCSVVNGGELGERKGVNVPNVAIRLPAITEKDKDDIRFGVEQGIDFIAASFVRNAECVLEIKAYLKELGAPYVPIIAKVENAEGIKNIDEIIRAADGVMVARGDLGVEIPAEEVPYLQKMIIQKCNMNFKTVITANSKWINLHLKETYEYRDLIFLFVRRDFISKYKQTILGPLWAVIQPLLTTIVFTVIFGSLANLTTLDVKATEETVIPAFLFYMAGTICWSYFSSTVSSTANTFVTNSSIMGKVYFPRLVSPAASTISNLISFGIQFAMFLIFLLYFIWKGKMEIRLSGYLFLFPILIIQMMMLAMGVGIIVSALTTKYRDLAMLIGFGLQLWQYGTPVAYGLRLVPEKYMKIYMLNPMTPIITSFRYIFFGTGYFHAGYYGMGWGSTMILFVLGIVLFNKVERTFMDTI